MVAADLPIGTVVANDFRVVRALGRGGMGVVYAADQLSTGKPRALKVMQGAVAESAEARERFVQEARVGAMIESDHVVETIAAGVDAVNGVHWLAMELLDGEDLASYARRRGALSPREVHEVFEQLCRGLAAAHERGVVHRDLKPENVFLARRARTRDRSASGPASAPAVLVKVLDFGIAKIVRADLTATGAIGTPLWMAPEQASMGARIAPATDVWALGLIAFYLLVGHVYWRADARSSAMELMREVLVEPLDRASARAAVLGAGASETATPHAVALPPAFDAWFARCVARDPATRFSDARLAWAALEPVLASMPGDESRIVLQEVPRSSTPMAPSPFDPTVPAAPITPRTPLRSQPEQARSVSPDQLPLARSRSKWAGRLVVTVALLAPVAVIAVAVVRARTPRAPTDAGALPPARANPRDAVTGAMIRLEGGTFLMGFDGTPQTAPRHSVTVAPFFLDETEVTVKAYAACVAAGECARPAARQKSNWEEQGDLRARHPINVIDWAAAHGFCRWAEKRLPTEEEWEFAATGGAAQRKFPWGDRDPTDDVCWNRKADGPTCEVASSAGDRTPEGIWDMGGNVFEWTESRYCPYDDPTCSRDSGLAMAMRTARGGQYAAARAVHLSPWFRSMVPDQGASVFLGVRCAR